MKIPAAWVLSLVSITSGPGEGIAKKRIFHGV